MSDPTTFARTLRRAPFALLSWVLSALKPADLLGPQCRALVIRVLVDIVAAVQAASFAKDAGKARHTLEALEERARAAFVALGEDAGALADEALPAPTSLVDSPTVARVLIAFARELELRGIAPAASFVATLDPNICQRLAARASAIEPPKEDEPAQTPVRKTKPRGP